jgi:hypothetical protein
MEWQPSSSSFAKAYRPQDECRLVLPTRAGKTQCFARRGSAGLPFFGGFSAVAAHAEGVEVLKLVRATLGPRDDVVGAEQEPSSRTERTPGRA